MWDIFLVRVGVGSDDFENLDVFTKSQLREVSRENVERKAQKV